jgi:negative regulator of sigma E activity
MRRTLVALVVLALACGKQNDDEKLQKSIASWKATLQIVAEAKLKNDVRDGFALKTIEEAVDDLEGQTGKTTNEDAARLIGLAGELRQAIQRDDPTRIAKVRDELAR